MHTHTHTYPTWNSAPRDQYIDNFILQTPASQIICDFSVLQHCFHGCNELHAGHPKKAVTPLNWSWSLGAITHIAVERWYCFWGFPRLMHKDDLYLCPLSSNVQHLKACRQFCTQTLRKLLFRFFDTQPWIPFIPKPNGDATFLHSTLSITIRSSLHRCVLSQGSKRCVDVRRKGWVASLWHHIRRCPTQRDSHGPAGTAEGRLPQVSNQPECGRPARPIRLPQVTSRAP